MRSKKYMLGFDSHHPVSISLPCRIHGFLPEADFTLNFSVNPGTAGRARSYSHLQ